MGRHGGGSRGGGGHSGGGHSGGGHSFHSAPSHHYGGHTTVVYTDHPHWHWRRRPRVWVSGCCCCFFVIVLVLILSLAPQSSSTADQITAYETVLVNPTTTWYESVTVETSEINYVKTLKFSSIPPLSSQTFDRNENHGLSVTSGNYEFWAYKLIASSSIMLSYNVTTNVHFYLIKGTTAFNSWVDGSSVSTEKSQFGTSLSNYTYTASSEDDYYYIWENTLPGTVTGQAQFLIRMKTYDTSNPTETCSGQGFCEMTLDKGSSDCVLIVGLDSQQSDDVYQVTYTLNPRLSYYWTIFGVLLAVWTIVVAAVLVALYMHYRRTLVYDPATAPFVPNAAVPPIVPSGALPVAQPYYPSAPPPVNPYYNS